MARWDRLSSRGNVEDRRGVSSGAVLGGAGGLGIVGAILMMLLGGGDLGDVLNQLVVPQAPAQVDASEFEGEDDYEVFASTVLGSTDELWGAVFAASNRTYNEPRLVLYRGYTDSACGGANSATGPHYCPPDETIYLDETFFDELTSRLGARGGDVAEAYVIAHEVGHHVQNELGLLSEVQQTMQSSSQDEANELSIKLELQADCFAGVWAYSVRDADVFLPGEINEAMDAAATVGDDRIQQTTTGRITPENWTHGSAEQRVSWFTKGFETGDPSQCNTFS